MTVFESILLGFIQGIAEFLPISSSGHLAIAENLLGVDGKGDLFYESILHVATMLAVILFFRHRVIAIIKAFFGLFLKKYRHTYFENKRFLWGILIASIPTAIIGLFLEKYAVHFFQNIIFVGYGLIITSMILAISDKFNTYGAVDKSKAFIIGVAQGIAVLPGISRSGATITVALMLGIKREEAAEFSFLLSLPAILGATLLQMRDINFASNDTSLYVYLSGGIVAFITAIASISFMLFIVKKAKFIFFAGYCLVVGIITVVFL